MSAVSATVRAIGPCTLSVSHAVATGHTGTQPGEVRNPTTPQNAAGSLSDPPRSEPWASGPIPVASATAPPPVEPAAGQRGIPRIARDPEHRVERVGARPELRRVGLADDDGAGRLEPLDHERVRLRHVVLEDLRPPGRADPLRRRQVLDRHRHAVQRPELGARACRAPPSPCAPAASACSAADRAVRIQRRIHLSIRASTARRPRAATPSAADQRTPAAVAGVKHSSSEVTQWPSTLRGSRASRSPSPM